MCGIYGYVATGEITKPKELFRVITKIAIESENRGTDATGFSAFLDGKVVFDKLPYRASVFAKLSPIFGKLEEKMPQSFIGHNRAASTGAGSPLINSNNHPFRGESYDLVHNGVIYDWREKAKRLMLDVRSGTDSEAYIRLLEKKLVVYKHNDEYSNLATAMAAIAHELNGKYAIALLNKTDGTVFLARNQNPIIVMNTTFFGDKIYFFASTESALRAAFFQTIGSAGIDSIKDILTTEAANLYRLSIDKRIATNNRLENFFQKKYVDQTQYYGNYQYGSASSTKTIVETHSYYNDATQCFSYDSSKIYDKIDGMDDDEMRILDEVSMQICSILGHEKNNEYNNQIW